MPPVVDPATSSGLMSGGWLAAYALIAIGLAGTVLPALPGTTLIFGGALLGAWLDGFQRVGYWTLGILGLLMLLSFAAEYAAGLMGAKRVGASRQALIGAVVGTVVGLLMGLVGVLFMPLVGAAIGEYMAQRNHQQAVRVGVATWVGLMLGMLAKVVIACVMVGVFLVALLG